MADRDRDRQGRAKSARPRDALGRPLPRDAAAEYIEEPDPQSEDEALDRGIAHFNNGRFFEAHEMWEFAWHPSPAPDRNFWQGITQVAVGFTHFQRGNVTGAVTLLDRGATKLETYGTVHKTLPVAEIASAARAAQHEIEKHGAEASLVPPEFRRV
ncbi:MAG TPA: DUF309 domain-containing protein [Actinomycetota bacterium]